MVEPVVDGEILLQNSQHFIVPLRETVQQVDQGGEELEDEVDRGHFLSAIFDRYFTNPSHKQTPTTDHQGVFEISVFPMQLPGPTPVERSAGNSKDVCSKLVPPLLLEIFNQLL